MHTSTRIPLTRTTGSQLRWSWPFPVEWRVYILPRVYIRWSWPIHVHLPSKQRIPMPANTQRSQTPRPGVPEIKKLLVAFDGRRRKSNRSTQNIANSVQDLFLRACWLYRADYWGCCWCSMCAWCHDAAYALDAMTTHIKRTCCTSWGSCAVGSLCINALPAFIASSLPSVLLMQRLDMIVVKQPLMMTVTVSRRGYTVLG